MMYIRYDQLRPPFSVAYKENGRWFLPSEQYKHLGDAIEEAKKYKEASVRDRKSSVLYYRKGGKTTWFPLPLGRK